MTAFLDNTCRPIVRAVCKNTAIEYEPVKEYWDRRMRIMVGTKKWFIFMVYSINIDCAALCRFKPCILI